MTRTCSKNYFLATFLSEQFLYKASNFFICYSHLVSMDTIYDQLLTISYNLGPKKFGSVSRIGQNIDRNRKLEMSKILNCIGHRRQNKLDMNFSSEVINKYHQGTVCTSL